MGLLVAISAFFKALTFWSVRCLTCFHYHHTPVSHLFHVKLRIEPPALQTSIAEVAVNAYHTYQQCSRRNTYISRGREAENVQREDRSLELNNPFFPCSTPIVSIEFLQGL